MIKEEVKEKFKEYMGKEIPNYSELLDQEEIESLLKSFNQWESYKLTAHYCLERQMNPNRVVDYTNDFENAMESAAQESQRLKRAINNIKEVYKIETGDDYEGKTRVN